ncbi:hypothetical protein MBLNU459_g6856t1 [Dothideomycetes sp. NU459]
MPTNHEVILAYRNLYRHLLRAVQYSKPARYTARDRLRHNFRTNPHSTFDAARIARTLEFLDGAARTKGLEHRIVKNLLHVWATKGSLPMNTKPQDTKSRADAYHEFDRTIEMLDQTMGTCIK